MKDGIKSLVNKLPLFKMSDKDKRKGIVQFCVLLVIFLMILGILDHLGK